MTGSQGTQLLSMDLDTVEMRAVSPLSIVKRGQTSEHSVSFKRPKDDFEK